MNEIAIEIIQEYVEEHSSELSSTWPKCEIAQQSYLQWSANEIISRIMDQPLKTPLDIIENFILEMSIYVRYDNSKCQNRMIFRIALETAEELALLFV